MAALSPGTREGVPRTYARLRGAESVIPYSFAWQGQAVGWQSRIPRSPSSEADVKTLRLAVPLVLAAFTLTCQSNQTAAPGTEHEWLFAGAREHT